MGKKPKITVNPSKNIITPKSVVTPINFYHSKAAWRFYRMKYFNNSGYGWDDMILEKENVIEVLERLHDLEQKTWDDLLHKEKKKNHPISVTDIIPEANKLLRNNHMDDIDSIYSFHLTSTLRIWGIFTGNVLDIIWWDKNHEICPSELKYT